LSGSPVIQQLRRLRSHSAPWLALVLGLGAVVAFGDADPPITLSGRIIGASGRFPVCVSLWNMDGFLETPAEEFCLAVGADLRYRFLIPPGRWAISAFEDQKGNGILDIGSFGPKEPIGFWRHFSGHHKPRFDEVADWINHDFNDANVVLK